MTTRHPYLPLLACLLLHTACGPDPQAISDYWTKLEAIYGETGGSMSVDAGDKDATLKAAEESLAKIEKGTKDLDAVAMPKGGDGLKAALLKNIAANKATITAFRDEVKGGGDIAKAFEKLQADKATRNATFQADQKAAFAKVGIQTN